jgi:hypothetical protein
MIEKVVVIEIFSFCFISESVFAVGNDTEGLALQK